MRELESSYSITKASRLSCEPLKHHSHDQEPASYQLHGKFTLFEKTLKAVYRSNSLHRSADAVKWWDDEHQDPKEAGKTWNFCEFIHSTEWKQQRSPIASWFMTATKSSSWSSHNTFWRVVTLSTVLDFPPVVSPYMLQDGGWAYQGKAETKASTKSSCLGGVGGN